MWYQTKIKMTETAKISVEMALISGVMPRRRRAQISRGGGLSRPIKKKVTAISSIERVKISRPGGSRESLREWGVGQRERAGFWAGGGAEIEGGFFLGAVDFLQAGEEFGGGDGDERRAVAEEDGGEAELEARDNREHQQGEAGDNSGEDQRKKDETAKDGFAGEGGAIERQGGEQTKRER